MTDGEKIAKLQEEKQILMKELAQAQEEIKYVEDEIEKKSFQNNNMDDDKRQ